MSKMCLCYLFHRQMPEIRMSIINFPKQDFKGSGRIYIKINFYCLHIAHMSINYAN